jgi:D-glycerate 3-kinase
LDEDLAAFLATEGLPETFRLTLERVCRPLAERALILREGLQRPALIGLCGAQGSGKSTIAAATVRMLQARGGRAVALSLDDFYLGREARGWLAEQVHPLLRTRGPPGTHDVPLGCGTLDALLAGEPVALPAFDKAADERRPRSAWREVEGPLDVIIFEGWCVGARPQPARRLGIPVNPLERDEDPGCVWRTYVNRQLAEPYQALFGRLDALVLLQAPGFEVVQAWRAEQEAKLRARTGLGMSDDEVARFIHHYERLTRWILEEMPGRADWAIPLATDRTPGSAPPALPA